MGRISHPESYVERSVAASMLRAMADEIARDADDRLISITVDRRWASQHEISRARKEPECPCAHCRVTIPPPK